MNSRYALKDLSIFKSLIKDYLNSVDSTRELHTEFPQMAAFENQIENKFLSSESRLVLSEELALQYKGIVVNEKVISNINLLKDSRTFTVTTGHQLNIFTGPLYSLIKIAQTIGLSRKLKNQYPGYNFVPVFWMATEDHDLEEIQQLNLFGQKVIWDTNQTGAVGEMRTDGLGEISEELIEKFNNNELAQNLLSDISNFYGDSKNLSEAHRKLVHKIFQKEELVVLDSNSKRLKELFQREFLEELNLQSSQKSLNETISVLKSKGYHAQVNSRDVNLFYLTSGYRSRITKSNSGFKTADDKISWTELEIEDEVKKFPERFSPNVILRPVYQEKILPNLAYIGGPGEVSYWLELKSVFNSYKVDFPFVILRNSHLFLSKKQDELLMDFGLSTLDVLMHEEELMKLSSLNLSETNINDEVLKINEILESISAKVCKTDNSLSGFSESIKTDLNKKISKLESKLAKNSKEKNERKLKKLAQLQKAVFENRKLNERTINFLSLLNSMSLQDLVEKFIEQEDSLESSLYVHISN